MNSKGQTLVIFVILLPILLFLFALIFEVGNLLIKESRYENEVQDTIKYGLDNLSLENLEDILKNLLKSNVEGDISISINGEIISITVKDNHKIFNQNFMIDITYHGHKEKNKYIIQKE